MEQLGRKTIAATGSTSSKSKIDIMWEKAHISTHNKVVVKQRTDRCQLLSISGQSRQVLQLCLWWFGELPGLQPEMVPVDNPTLHKAFDFIVPLAEMWQSDKVKTKNELLARRDEKLATLDISRRGKIKKRDKINKVEMPSGHGDEPQTKKTKVTEQLTAAELPEDAELFAEQPVFLEEIEDAALESLT